MSLDVAESIVAEAERLRREEEEGLSVVLKYTFVYDTCETMHESVKVAAPLGPGPGPGPGPQPHATACVLFRSLRWHVEAAAHLKTLVDHLVVALFSQAFGGYVSTVEHVHMEVLHRGVAVIRVCWPRCSELTLDDIQTGTPEAREMMDFFGLYVDVGVRGAGIQLPS